MIKFNKTKISLIRDHGMHYDVHFADGIFDENSESLRQVCTDKTLLIVIDRKVFDLYGEVIESFFKKIGSNYFILQIDANENKKEMEAVLMICDAAKKFHFKRDSILIGIGGGITLDIVGFAASMYRRKVRYIRIPTTLVGQIDAGVGVKVGINFNNSKNLLGAYYPPISTFNDQLFLNTLDISEMRSGLYEALKMAIIKNKKLFSLLEVNLNKFFDAKFDKSTDSVLYQATFSMMKELEPNLHESELKRCVDFGHTFSQFIEESSGFRIKHGEAVGIDIVLSSYIAHSRKILREDDFMRIIQIIKKIGFTEKYSENSAEKMFESLEHVKNHRAGNLNLVLPTGIGKFAFTNDCAQLELQDALNFYVGSFV